MPTPAEFSQRDLKGYNLGKAILEFAERGHLTGLEREADQEMTKRSNRRPTSFWVPTDALVSRTAQLAGTATLGGNLIQTTVGTWIDQLRARMVFGQMGMTMMSGLYGNVALPKLNGGGSGNVQFLTETQACTLSELNFTQVVLSPKCAAVGMEYSKQLFAQSNVHEIVLADLASSLANAIDQAVAHGGGSASFTGLQIATGVNAVTISANGGAPSWQNVLDLEEAVATANGSNGASGYLTNPKVRSYLKRTAQITNVSGPVWPVARSTDNFETLNAYRALVTSAVSNVLTKGTATTCCSAAFFSSDWSQAVLGLWGALDITVDSTGKAANRLVDVWAHQFCDFQLKQPACFARTLELLA